MAISFRAPTRRLNALWRRFGWKKPTRREPHGVTSPQQGRPTSTCKRRLSPVFETELATCASGQPRGRPTERRIRSSTESSGTFRSSQAASTSGTAATRSSTSRIRPRSSSRPSFKPP
eukprot:scaffold513764_cov17-Prasinocladus_malaysianus.AAC.1